MKSADSKVYQVAYAKEMQDAHAMGTKRAAETATAAASKAAKKALPAAKPPSPAAATPAAAIPAEPSQLSSALQQMLAAAKGNPSVQE